MIIAADTSPLVAFSCIRRMDVLRRVAGEIWIPPAVVREVVDQGAGWLEAEDLQSEIATGEWISRAQIHESQLLDNLRRRLGDGGEAEAIALAHETNQAVLLDELAGRKEASKLGIHVIGSLRILKLAKEGGTIPAAAPLIRSMQNGGIYYANSLVEKFLREIGEFR